MHKQTIHLPVHQANNMDAYTVSPDEKGKHPGVLVFQEAFGVNDHIKEVTERIASAGYVAIAPELFHRTAPPGHTMAYSDFEAVRSHIAALTPETMLADVNAAYGWLRENQRVNTGKIGSIGFCLGGRVSFLANASVKLAAAVSYYGGGLQTLADRAALVSAPHLFYWGGMDKHILPEHRDAITRAMGDAGKPYANSVFSYADHGFNCEARPSYNPHAAKEAWAMTMAFFANNLLQ